jgi:HTH-type transcriptional regulator/antitoxin HigA
MLGSRGRVSEIITRKRPLTLEMIRRLQAGLGLPADALVRPYPLRKSAA